MKIPLLSTVALIEDIPNEGLTRGQIGTVVEELYASNEWAVLVEFADQEGRAYAMVPLLPKQLLLLHRNYRAA